MHQLALVHRDLPHDRCVQRLDDDVRDLGHDLAGHRDDPIDRIEAADRDRRQDRRRDDPDRQAAGDGNAFRDDGRGGRLELQHGLAGMRSMVCVVTDMVLLPVCCYCAAAIRWRFCWCQRC